MRALATLLEPHGWTVMEAADTAAAQRACIEGRPDVALLDALVRRADAALYAAKAAGRDTVRAG